MASRGFFHYLKLKFLVSLIRFLNYFALRKVLKPSETCVRKSIRIPSRDLKRFIDAWIYYPDNYVEGTPRGVVVNWHGGAYMMPNLGMDHPFCERVARESDVLVLDVDYRKGPEHPFPGAVEDAEDVLRWVQSQSRTFDPDRVALSGFSSGGHLCLVAASELRREFAGALNIRAVYAFYPGTDFSIDPEAKATSVSDPIAPMPAFFLQLINDMYLPNAKDRTLPKASPTYAPIGSFPPHVMLFPCSGDVLSPEVLVFGEKLKQGGIDAQTFVVPNAAHGFDKPTNSKYFNEEQRKITYSKVVESLKAVM